MRDFHQAKASLCQAKLYAIVDLGYVTDDHIAPVTAQLIAGGADIIQLRAKEVDLTRVMSAARLIQPLCREGNIPFILNDYPELVVELGADGVHVGQDDATVEEARAHAGVQCLVGKSTHHPTQAFSAMEDGADYIGFGPLFPTLTKPGRPSIGMENIAGVEAAMSIPMFCIGGIHLNNLPVVQAAGAKRVVIVSALLKARNIQETTRRARNMLN